MCFNLAIFTSTYYSYSVLKAAMTCGIGTSNAQQFPIDAKGQMDATHLEQAVWRTMKIISLHLMSIALLAKMSSVLSIAFSKSQIYARNIECGCTSMDLYAT